MSIITLMLWAALVGKPNLQAELSRLIGHTVEVNGSDYQITDIAGEGAPIVGCVQRRGAQLFLKGDESSWKLTGPLAVPRIAGPNYKVWVVGTPDAGNLPARRLGILASPQSSGCTLREPSHSQSHDSKLTGGQEVVVTE